MKNFIKKFKSQLENRPAPEFEETDWLALEKQLDAAAQAKKRPAAAWLFLLPLLMASVGGNVFLFQKMKKTAEKTAAAAPATAAHDTIYIYTSRVEQRTDTVFRTRVVRERVFVGQNLAAANSETGEFSFQKNKNATAASLETGSFSPKKIESTATGTDILKGKISQQENQNTMSAAKSDGNELPQNENQNGKMEDIGTKNGPQQTALEKLPTLPTTFLTKGFPEIPGIDAPPYRFKKRRSFQQTVHAFRPKSVYFGAAGGWSIPVSEGFENRHGYSFGGEVQVGFSPSLRFWADATYFQWQFVADRMDESLGIPLVSPPSVEFVFKKADAVQPSLHFSMGLEHIFRAQKTLRPFLGIGLGTAKLFSSTLDYEFFDPATGIEWNVDPEIKGPATLSHFFTGRAGAIRHLPKGWGISVRLDFRQPLGIGQVPRNFGLQASVLKKF